MATVFLAKDIRHERDVAIKVLHPELSASIGADRFEREIKLAARLQHPNILGLYDSGATEGLLYYVMPFIKGESLRDRLDREGQLPIDDAINITLEVAEALVTPTRRESFTGTSSRKTSSSPAATRWSRTSASRAPRARAAPRSSPRPAWRSAPGVHGRRSSRWAIRSGRPPTSTASAACCTRCWPVSRRSPPRTPWR
jgi:hypothetical protein